MTASVRAFFALPLPAAAIEVLSATREHARPFVTSLSPRFTTAEQMHVTLAFLGDIAPPVSLELERVAAALAGRHPPFTAKLSRLTSFGGPERARVLIVEVETDSPTLTALASELESAAAELGVPRQERAFRPHVTLARFKHPGSVAELLSQVELAPLQLEFSELRLVASTLTPSGSQYRVIAAHALGTSPPPA